MEQLNTECEDTADRNLRYIGEGFYVVHTQAGFRKLLKKYEWKKDDTLTGCEYPSTYPSLVSIVPTGPGNAWFNVKAIGLDALKAVI